MSDSTPILELNKSAVSIPFEIHSMEWVAQNRWEQNQKAHRHNYFSIIWVKRASGYQMIDLQKLALENDTVYCIAPGQVHLLELDAVAEGYVISFTAEFMSSSQENLDMIFGNPLFNSCSRSAVIKVSEDLKDDMEDMAVKMMKEYANFFLLRAEILKGYLKIFLIFLTRQFETTEPIESQSKNNDLVRRFMLSLESHYLTERSVAYYADHLIVTANYLNEVVKKNTGFPASHHIQQRIILEAKRYAAYSTMTMKEVAYSLGFEDVAHFSKFFKNVSGKTFTDFRKESVL